jgi:predicted hotdog family 3-hydroxylacyl-ACP dehydratase
VTEKFPAALLRPADLLPHRDAMLLIDTLLSVDENHAVAESVVKRNWPMALAEGVSSLLAIELAAQTIGVCNVWGLMQRHGENTNKNGWLVAIKKAVFHSDLLPFDARLTIRAENGFSFDMFREATGWVYREGALIAEIVVQIYQVETTTA